MKVLSWLLLLGFVSCVTRHSGIDCPPERMGDPECGNYVCPAGQMVMGTMCVTVGACPTGQRNGGGGVCVPEGQCAEGYHPSGDARGTCVKVGMCTADYIDDGAGACVQDTSSCASGFHDDGTHDVCVRNGKCATGFHNGGDGTCVAMATCATGYHDGGTGNCLVDGMCSAGYHDGGDGKCVSLDVCSPMYFDNGVGNCVRDTASCAMGFHDGGHGASCRPGMQCDPGADWNATMRTCIGNGSGGSSGGGGSGGDSVPPCCDLPPPTDPCGMPGSTCSLTGRNSVRFAGSGPTVDSVQVRVDLPASWKGASLRADCSDLVFREMDGTWAPHWVEDCNAAAGPRVWLRVKHLDASAGTTVTAFHGGAAQPMAQSFDRVFDKLPSRDPAMMGGWTFDEGRGAHTRHSGPSATFWYAIPASSDPAAPQSDSSSLAAAIWTPTDGGFWNGRRDVKFTSGHAFKVKDKTTFRVTPAQSPKPTRGITLAAWFKVDHAEMAWDWITPVSYGSTVEWGQMFAATDPAGVVGNFNPYALFLKSGADINGQIQAFGEANDCDNRCSHEGDYNHVQTVRPLVSDAQLTAEWHFMVMTLDFMTHERHLYWDGMDYGFEMCPGSTTQICDHFLGTPISQTLLFAVPDVPLTIGADYNYSVDGYGLDGQLDDVFILNRAASAADVQAFYERRYPIVLPVATVM